MTMTLQGNTDWLGRFQQEKVIWQMINNHDPHVKTSMLGEHVNAYFNSDIVTSRPELLEQAINDILLPVIQSAKLKPDWVVSYAPYGLFIAYACARKLNAKCGYTNPNDDYKTSFRISPSEKVLVIADDIYSGAGVRKTIVTLENMNATVLPIVFCLANLSGSAELDNREITSAAYRPAQRYQADTCLFCEQGSEALLARPNWEQLTAG
jgi:orotate phosphoribosyltransferase